MFYQSRIDTSHRWRTRRKLLRICLASTLLIGPGCLPLSSAQALPPTVLDAANTLRQQERERLLRQQQERTPDINLPAPARLADTQRLPDDEAQCVQVQRIVLVGDAADQFQWALAAANHTGAGEPDTAAPRCLGPQGINLVMQRMQDAIARRGYVTTRVLASSQPALAQGTLTLSLLPGRIGQIRFVPGTAPRATQWNAMPVGPGDLLNLHDIEQALENFRRIPSAEADIIFANVEGADVQPGQTDLLIRWQQGLPLRLTLSVDDGGSRSTGKLQGSATLSHDHWWTLNDLFYASFSHDLGDGDPGTRGTQGVVVHYSLPLGPWLLGLTASSNRYHQSVAGLNQTYLYAGTNDNSAVTLSRVVSRGVTHKTTLSVAGWQRTSSNFIDDTEVQVQRRRMAGWDAGVAHRQAIGTAAIEMDLNYRRGTGAGGALPAPEEAFGEGSSRARIITAQAQLNLPFTIGAQALRFSSAWRGQWNGTPLVPQDRFAIGGRHTVRGFNGEQQLLAERGWTWRNDLGWQIGPHGQELYLGIDSGQVGGPSSAALAGTRLGGAVIGLRGRYRQIYFDLFAGTPLVKPDGFKAPAQVAGFTLTASM